MSMSACPPSFVMAHAFLDAPDLADQYTGQPVYQSVAGPASRCNRPDGVTGRPVYQLPGYTGRPVY